MLIIWSFLVLIAICIFAVITHMLNEKPKCKHNWEEIDQGLLKCSKCNKTAYVRSSEDEKDIAA